MNSSTKLPPWVWKLSLIARIQMKGQRFVRMTTNLFELNSAPATIHVDLFVFFPSSSVMLQLPFGVENWPKQMK